MDAKRRRVDLSLKVKGDIIDKVEKGAKYNDIASFYGIGKSTVSDIIKNKNNIKATLTSSVCLPDRKRLVLSNFPQVEASMNMWIQTASGLGGLSDCHLLLQAQDFAVRFGHDRDDIKLGWICRWKARNGLQSKVTHGESGSVEPEIAEAWKKDKLPSILRKYSPDDIYNADETGLFWKLLANKTVAFKNQIVEGGKQPKDRVTLLVTANMAGKKEPLFVIGKSQNPRCFKRNMPPFRYDYNKKAWMTSYIFNEFVQRFDRKMAAQSRHVALIVDNCPAHPKIEGLKNVELIFLPPNTTAKTQPMDAGVIRCFKSNYRRRLATRQLIAFNQEKKFTFDLLDALYIAQAAWSDITNTTIQNCYKHVGFIEPGTVTLPADSSATPEDSSPLAGDNIWERLRSAGLLPEDVEPSQYLSIDDEVASSGVMTAEEIVL